MREKDNVEGVMIPGFLRGEVAHIGIANVRGIVAHDFVSADGVRFEFAPMSNVLAKRKAAYARIDGNERIPTEDLHTAVAAINAELARRRRSSDAS